jgi:membrane AbrB-like protein
MGSSAPQRPPGSIARIIPWLGLLGASAALATAMAAAHLPAALLLGPMISAIAFAVLGAKIRLSRSYSLGAQIILGCLIAKFMNPELLAVLASHGATFIGFALTTLLLTAMLGSMITRLGWLPGTAAIWGLSPGAAGAMVLLADEYGADKRIVALMQYSRIILVALAAVVVAKVLGRPGTAANSPLSNASLWSWPTHGLGLLETVLLCGASALIVKFTGKSSAALLIPTFAGAALQGTGLITIELPPLISTLAFGVIGWYVGLSFTRETLAYCLKLLPRMIGAILLMMLVCGGLSLVLGIMMPGMDPLTAYLAMSPGGMDTAVIIATTTRVSLPMVLAAQLVRLMLVIVAGPTMAKFVARRH